MNRWQEPHRQLVSLYVAAQETVSVRDRRRLHRTWLFVAVTSSLLASMPALAADQAGPARSELAEASDPAGEAAQTARQGVAAEGQGEAQGSDRRLPLSIEEQVIVTASRAERDVFDEPFIVELVSEEDSRFRKKVGGFVDSFDEMPAVWVQKTSQGQGSPFVRGFTGFHNLILVDGIRLNTSIFRPRAGRFGSAR